MGYQELEPLGKGDYMSLLFISFTKHNLHARNPNQRP